MNRATRDAGVVLPFVALSMIALLTVVAIVIDLGATRSFRRDTRLAADAGATAGALGVKDTTGTGVPCITAMAYAFRDVGGTQPSSAAIASACGSMTATCSGTSARTATMTVDSTTITVTNPVPDGSPLMDGTSLGSGVTQGVNATVDGVPCDRVGVQITRPQPSFFRGIMSSSPGTYTVHSVARYSPNAQPGSIPPALVALNQTACKAIDAGSNGNIVLVSNSVGPGIAYSDSNGPGCSGSNAILASRSSARLVAESSGAVVGELGWFSAPDANGYNSASTTNQVAPATFGSTSQNYVGRLFARDQRVTRAKVDDRYHCKNVPVTVQTLCTTTDPILALQALAAGSTASAPSGYATYSGACDTTAAAIVFPTGNLWVNCPTFTVKGNSLRIPGGSTVIFNGALSVESNGTLLVNTTGSTDGSGYPVPTDGSKQSTVLVNSTSSSAVSISSNASSLLMAQTMLYNGGGFTLSSSQSIHWTPPTTGDLKGLLYWSESTQPFSIQGGPQIKAKGVVFHGNGQLIGGGGGTIDLTKVQMWVDTMATGGSTTVRLAADPENSITLTGAGSALIR
ncbi:MAG: hypothetical protein QOI95_1053 [Acidimicrobiaceae bacterium]|jgi:hypothetical protein